MITLSKHVTVSLVVVSWSNRGKNESQREIMLKRRSQVEMYSSLRQMAISSFPEFYFSFEHLRIFATDEHLSVCEIPQPRPTLLDTGSFRDASQKT